jgi:hypothetical protein
MDDGGGVCVDMCTNSIGYKENSGATLGHECYKFRDIDTMPYGCITDNIGTTGYCICDTTIGFLANTFDTEPKDCLPVCFEDHGGTPDTVNNECWSMATPAGDYYTLEEI